MPQCLHRWLEKLGLSAREGVSVVIRQVLYGHNYGLLDTDMNPNPVSVRLLLLLLGICVSSVV